VPRCGLRRCAIARARGKHSNLAAHGQAGPTSHGRRVDPRRACDLCDAPGVVGNRYAVYAWGIRGEVCPADLIYTPPDVPHSIYAHHSEGRCLGFAATFTPEGAPTNTPVEFDNWPPQS
jgi:hypothetical protein